MKKKLIYFVVKCYFHSAEQTITDYFKHECETRLDVYGVIGYLTQMYQDISNIFSIDWYYNQPVECDPYCIDKLPAQYTVIKDKPI